MHVDFFQTASPKTYVKLNQNLVRRIRATWEIKLKLFCFDIQDGFTVCHLEILQRTSLKPYVELNPNLMGGIRANHYSGW